MRAFVEELSSVVLSVDVHEIRAGFPELGSGDRPAVDAADVLPVRGDPAEQDQVAVRIALDPEAVVPGVRHILAEHGRDGGGILAGPDDLAAGPASGHQVQGVDHDGFPRPGLTGQDRQPFAERKLRGFDHGQVFHLQQSQHFHHSPFFRIRAFP